ncbi:hypothetical protein D3C71_1867350 [compost metagenome]
MLQGLSENFAQQAAKWPFCAVLEAGDQGVQREAVDPGRDDLLEGWRNSQTLAAGEVGHGQRQGADLAMIAQPGQFGFAGYAEGVAGVGRLVAEQTGLFVF